jgi:SAM-dependent methyltransferase
MIPMRFRRLLPALVLCLAALSAAAQETRPFAPYVGLPGKDVIWLPAELVMVNKMLDLAKLTPSDVVMDLGSGDGRTVIGAAKRGARGIGVEFNPDLVEHSRRNAEKEGVANRASFERGDLFEADLSRATVITLFLLPSINLKLRPKLLELKPGTRIVGNTFTMDEWKPDETVRDETRGEGCGFNCIAYLWVVPARAAGAWQTPEGEMKLEQRFQEVSGTIGAGNRQITVAGKLLGDRITLSGPGVEYSGRVDGNAIEGTAKGEKPGPWKATRR